MASPNLNDAALAFFNGQQPIPVTGGGGGSPGPSGGTQVEGTQAQGVTGTANPVIIGGLDNSGNVRKARMLDNNMLAVGLGSPFNGNVATVQAPNNDAVDQNNQALFTFALQHQWDINTLSWRRTKGDNVSVFAKAPPLVLIDRSIVATTTSQQAAAANNVRTKLRIQNTSTTGDLWYNFGAAAVVNGLSSFRLTPGSYLEDTGTNQALFVIASTGTVNATIKEA